MQLRILLIAASVLLAWAVASGQSPAKGATLDDLRAAIRREDYAKARAVADSLRKSANPADRQGALDLYGRILLAQGQSVEAKRFLAEARSQKADENSKQLLEVHSAWLDALTGKQAEAIKSLQAILQRQAAYESTAEAAEVLARIHILQGDREAATGAVEFGLRFLKYQQMQSAYLEELLKRRLEEAKTASSDPAEVVYRQAEALRTAQKFAEAAVLYERIRKEHATSVWSHAAGFRIGQCLVGAGRFAEALKHWDAFLAEAPTGPWRAQAHVAAIDLLLEETFQLEKASTHATVATTVLRQGFDKAAAPSWREATYDIHLRAGLVALVERNHAGAAREFELARFNAPRGATAGLDELIAEAKAGRDVAPEEVRQGNPQAAVCLALGAVYNLVQQFDRATGLFERVGSGAIKGSSPAQRAFAIYGAAVANSGRGKPLEAKQGYLVSLKAYGGGSWHDETLFRLALLIQDQADRHAAPPKKEGAKKDAPAPKNTTAERARERERDEKARDDRQKQLVKERNEALPHWLQLIRTYPKSRRVEPALYHSGVLFAEAERFEPALLQFTDLVKMYPSGSYAGAAHVWLVDVNLEQLLELPAARREAGAAIEWLQARLAEVAADTKVDPSDAGARPVRAVAYDIYIRAGLIAFLDQKLEEAARLFKLAQPYAPPRGIAVVAGSIPTGIEQIVAAAKAGKKLTPPEATHGSAKAHLMLALADIYCETQQFDRSTVLCERVLHRVADASALQRSWALFRRARNRYGDVEAEDYNWQGARDDYLASRELAPDSSWADQALFLAANMVYNFEQDIDRAVGMWRELVRDYPRSDEAGRASYFVGVAYEGRGDLQKARRVFQEFLSKYPDSPFAELVAKLHLKRIEEAIRTGAKRVNDGAP